MLVDRAEGEQLLHRTHGRLGGGRVEPRKRHDVVDSNRLELQQAGGEVAPLDLWDVVLLQALYQYTGQWFPRR